jgi:hypothetical protein
MADATAKALDMLAAFASVGVRAFDVTFTDLAGAKVGYRPNRQVDELRRVIGRHLQETTARRQNFIIRPRGNRQAELIQLDDLAEGAAAAITPLALMVLCTSPGNYQAWVAVKDAPEDFARRLKKGAGADPSASGATRIAGSLNFKTKYAPAFPTVEITRANVGQVVTAGELESRGFVAPLEQQPPARVSNRQARPYTGRRKWPSYQMCLDGAPPSQSRPGKTRDSIADFTWCMTALDWGWSIEDTAGRLMEESSKARENGEGYALTTATNAAAAIARRARPVKSPAGPR